MIRNENSFKTKKCSIKNRKNYDWWPIDSKTGSNLSYNKWIEESKFPNKKYNCCDCIIS